MPASSRPLMILTAATVALMALWIVAPRPKPVAVDNTPLAATQQVPKAKAAAAVSDAANAKLQAATGQATPAAPPATPASKAAAPKPAAPKPAAPKAAAKPIVAKGDAGKIRDAAVVRDLERGRIVVLLFWNPTGADDIAARGALRDLDLRGGKVVVRVVPITRAAQYKSITSGVKIAQSPTTLVMGGRGSSTRVIVGLTETRELSHAVGDALADR